MNMKPEEYVASIKGNNDRAKEFIARSLHALDSHSGAAGCDAFPDVAQGIRANSNGVLQIMDNQLIHAKYVTNGGLIPPTSDCWKIGLGPIKASGRSIKDFVVIATLALVVYLHVTGRISSKEIETIKTISTEILKEVEIGQ